MAKDSPLHASVDSDMMTALLEEVQYARPLIDAIADWERENGTVAAIMPFEYEDFLTKLKYAALKGSARGSQSVRYDKK